MCIRLFDSHNEESDKKEKRFNNTKKMSSSQRLSRKKQSLLHLDVLHYFTVFLYNVDPISGKIAGLVSVIGLGFLSMRACTVAKRIDALGETSSPLNSIFSNSTASLSADTLLSVDTDWAHCRVPHLFLIKNPPFLSDIHSKSKQINKFETIGTPRPEFIFYESEQLPSTDLRYILTWDHNRYNISRSSHLMIQLPCSHRLRTSPIWLASKSSLHDNTCFQIEHPQ